MRPLYKHNLTLKKDVLIFSAVCHTSHVLYFMGYVSGEPVPYLVDVERSSSARGWFYLLASSRLLNGLKRSDSGPRAFVTKYGWLFLYIPMPILMG